MFGSDIMDWRREKTMKELDNQEIDYRPLYIQLQVQEIPSFEQKTRLIKLMPKFQGLANEDPYKHTKEFSWVWLVKFLIMQLLKK